MLESNNLACKCLGVSIDRTIFKINFTLISEYFRRKCLIVLYYSRINFYGYVSTLGIIMILILMNYSNSKFLIRKEVEFYTEYLHEERSQ